MLTTYRQNEYLKQTCELIFYEEAYYEFFCKNLEHSKTLCFPHKFKNCLTAYSTFPLGYHVAGEGNLIPSEWDYLGEQRVPEEEDQDGGGRGTSVMMPCRMFSDR